MEIFKHFFVVLVNNEMSIWEFLNLFQVKLKFLSKFLDF